MWCTAVNKHELMLINKKFGIPKAASKSLPGLTGWGCPRVRRPAQDRGSCQGLAGSVEPEIGLTRGFNVGNHKGSLCNTFLY